MKKIIITAGGTREKIDNVRRITNSSSGKLGMIIANQLLMERKDIFIYYVCSKNSLRPNDDRIKIIEIDGTIDLKNNIENLLKNDQIDYFIHSMAVSDYMTDYVTTVDKIKKSILEHNDVDDVFKNIEVVGGNKISSHEDNLVIVLKQTPKIISIIKDISPSTYLVGFKLLDEVSKNELIEEAKRLRNKNNCDLVVANDLSNIRKGEHKGYIIDKNNNIEEAFGKDDIAKILIKKMFNDKKLRLINNFNEDVDVLYNELLRKKEQFIFMNYNNSKYVLTKEKSIIPIEDVDEFLQSFKDDVYYKSIIKDEKICIENKDLELYKYYIGKYRKQLTEKKYNDKYYFGCVAVKTKNGFITTIRGKKDLNEYTLIEKVNHKNHTISVFNKKATLNAPLIDILFKNKKVKAIVHLHEFDNNLPFYDYAFPGTVKDSMRDNKTSFNIRYHGVLYLIDKNGNIL